MISGPPQTPRPPTPLYLAFERVEHRRDMRTMERYRVLHEDPGPAHALDAANTREGDPWRRYGSRGVQSLTEPKFYESGGPRAACGKRVLVALPREFDPDDAEACTECAVLVVAGKARGRFRQPDLYDRDRDLCDAAVRIEEDGEVSVYECRLRWRHRDAHRDGSGATWETGPEDFTPPPDGYV